MLPPQPTLPADQRQLLKLYKSLEQADREALLAFAEFLQQRGKTGVESGVQAIVEPKVIPRPEKESVVAAMRRLSETYHMVDKSLVLDQASALMGAHMLQGEPAEQVIDQLESLFENQYQQLINH